MVNIVEKIEQGFTLIEIIVCLAILGILAALAGFFYLDSLEKAKAVEASAALSEVVRLQHLHYAHTGTYASDLQELGFRLSAPLAYHELFVQVQKDYRGWGYIAMALPLGRERSDQGGWAVAQHPGGKLQSSLPGTMKSGSTSACGIWSGWGSMEGGRIEGEEGLQSSSSSGGASPCGMRVVSHGKK